MDTETGKLPRHLEPLIQPTPSGVSKLLAAWDGLLVETQIAILTWLWNLPSYPIHLARKVGAKALASETPYIRYLAATRFTHRDTADTEARARIEADPDPLVRYSTKEAVSGFGSMWLGSHDAEKFWALPHEARLATVRLLIFSSSDQWIAEIVSYALDTHLKDRRVSEIEIYEVLADYPLKPYRRYDGPGEDRGLESLWRLVPKSPPEVADLLVKTLPPITEYWTSDIPKEVIASLSDHELKTLLDRPDIDLHDLRRDLFRTAGKDREFVRRAAISSHFSIEDLEFAEILALPDKERFEALEVLAEKASDLRLCVYEALSDYLYDTDADYAVVLARQAKKARLNKLRPGSRRDEELHELRLYLLAFRAVPAYKEFIASAPDEELEFLAKHVVEGDTWGTFMAFKAQWRSMPRSKALEKYLPRIEGIDADADEDNVDGPTA